MQNVREFTHRSRTNRKSEVHRKTFLRNISDRTGVATINRFLEAKTTNGLAHRQIVRDLERLKNRALIDKKIDNFLRTIEIRVGKVNFSRRFEPNFKKKLRKRFQQEFSAFPRSIELFSRFDSLKSFQEITESFLRSNDEQNSKFLEDFDRFLQKLRSRTRRQSKTSDLSLSKASLSSNSLEI